MHKPCLFFTSWFLFCFVLFFLVFFLSVCLLNSKRSCIKFGWEHEFVKLRNVLETSNVVEVGAWEACVGHLKRNFVHVSRYLTFLRRNHWEYFSLWTNLGGAGAWKGMLLKLETTTSSNPCISHGTKDNATIKLLNWLGTKRFAISLASWVWEKLH